MPHLIKYGVLSASNIAVAGNLVKAQCDICGRKFGSVDEAKDCENGHINMLLRNLNINKGITNGGENNETETIRQNHI